MEDKELANIQEKLATLYLRLNGYLTSGFIIHKPNTDISGELDIIGIRFPFHAQMDTEHNSSSFLETPTNIDLVIGEVKSNGQKLQFNKSLWKKEKSVETWCKIFKWVGIIEETQISTAVSQIIELIKPKENSQLSSIKKLDLETKFGNLSIRPIIFSPERNNMNNADKFINWTEINDFTWSCLCPQEPREQCATHYDYTSWGSEFYEIIKAYKDRQESQKKFSSISELYTDILDLRNSKT